MAERPGIHRPGKLRPPEVGYVRTSDAARDSADRILYDRDYGVLCYDADGTGASEQVAFAKLSVGFKMTALDFRVI
jgi:hypothetical protein